MQKDFWVGDYLVSPKHNKLTLLKQTFTLEPKVMAILCLLVKNHGEVLSRQEILSTLWPNQVTEPEVVTRAIFELRKVFCDNPKQPTYIETIAKKGYCFIHPTTPIKGAKNRKRSVIGLVGLFVFFGLSSLVYFTQFMLPTNVGPTTQFKVQPLSSSSDKIVYAAPDSHWQSALVISGEDRQKQLSIKSLHSHKSTPLTPNTSDYRSPIWGSKSNSWYYVNCLEASCAIEKYTVSNGAQERVFSTNDEIKSIALADSENILALSLKDSSNEQLALLDLNADRPLLTYITQPGLNMLPVFLPHQEGLFYVNFHATSSTRIMYYDIAQHKSSEASSKLDRITALVSAAANTLIAAAKVKGEYALWQLDLDSNRVTRYASIEPGANIKDLHLSKSGEKLLYIKNNSDLDIKFAGFPSAFSNINSDAHDMKAVMAAANSIYFVSNRTGSYELWRHHDDSNEKLTALFADSIAQPVLSPTQDKLAFITRRNNQSRLHLYNAKSAATAELDILSSGSFLLGWSHDEKELYLSIRSENLYDLAKYNIATGELKTIKLGAGLLASEDPSTNNFYYGDLASSQLKRTTEDGSEESLYDFTNTPLLIAPNSIKVADGLVYYLGNTKQGITLIHDKETLLTLPKGAFVSQILTKPTPRVIYDIKVLSPSILEMQVAHSPMGE
ncbi:winged helix-turn-helix domain-containing protein [Pseudoalteromonas sp. YIC-656]|uniref:winged helix-turn-helix domain-containing protein n=1 Tax=Pseudoalteromonas pernae TaxID=3118054 RepID=UPI003241CAA4